MQIEENTYVAIDYILTLDSGEEVDRSQEGAPLGFITGIGQVIPGLEDALMGMKAGESAKITVGPDDAYGPVQEDMVQEVPRDQFPDDMELAPEMVFEANGPHGPMMLVVKSINDSGTVTVDFNHPMAGLNLNFDITVREVRLPSAEEIAQMASESMGGGCGCGCGGDDDEDGDCGCGPDSGRKDGCGCGCG